MNQLKKIIIITIVFNLTGYFSSLTAQQINGHVYEVSENQKKPLVGVNVYWLNTTIGTVTDANGYFEINRKEPHLKNLIFSYVGYRNDTVDISDGKSHIHITLVASKELQETVIETRGSGAYISRLEPTFTEVITSHELQRAACCNLSESFETNPSVDVSYSDAITGAKQIELLGLSGIYSQILTENIPSVRGPAIPYGLLYVPGPWMSSIHISKGTSAVINGYESITGQINVEYKKPEDSEKFFLNVYTNDLGKVESSITSAHQINDNWYTMILAHGEYLNRPTDHNKNTFMDHPLVKKYNVMNRYRYDKPGKMESMFGFRILEEDRNAGQMPNAAPEDVLYKAHIKTSRYEAFAKTGFFSQRNPSRSLGTIFSGTYHKQNSIFGNNTYDVIHQNFYANIIHETPFINNHHTLNSGVSFNYDHFDETINNEGQHKEEIVPGVFTQYTYNNQSNWSAIAGIRYDHHNLHGHLITPRFHSRLDINENITWRASIGKGYRMANIFAENPLLFMNSREIYMEERLLPEEAINYGTSITYNFFIVGRESTFSTEFYRTDFNNQVIINLDRNPREIHIYNLDGQSYSNSAQASFSTEPINRLDFLAAIRWTDVKTTYDEELKSKPLVNTYKGLISLSYLTKNNKWQIDLTSQFNGRSRLPDTSLLPEIYQKPSYAPSYTILNSQITYKRKNWDIYLGVENLTSYVQKDPIISYENPYGDYFDAGFIWGPIMPRMFYAGLRFSIE